MSGSPLPERYAVEMPRPEGRGGGWAWYVAERWRPDDFGSLRGGPFESREGADAAIERWAEDLAEWYDAVERQAREGGYTVTWGRPR